MGILNKLSNKKLSFLITFIYVLLGTIHLYNKTSIALVDIVLYFIFILAEVFPFLILYSEKDPNIMVLKCQIITVLILWPLTLLITKLLRKKSNQSIS